MSLLLPSSCQHNKLWHDRQSWRALKMRVKTGLYRSRAFLLVTENLLCNTSMYLHAALGTAGGSLPYLTTRETFQAHHGELYLKKLARLPLHWVLFICRFFYQASHTSPAFQLTYYGTRSQDRTFYATIQVINWTKGEYWELKSHGHPTLSIVFVMAFLEYLSLFFTLWLHCWMV